MTTLLLLAALGQFRYGGAVDSPAPPPSHAAAVADPFPARAVPTGWRIRRATDVTPPKPAPDVAPDVAPAAAQPPPGLLDPLRERLDAIDAALQTILARLDARPAAAAAPKPVATATPSREVHVIADRFGRQWDDSLSGYQGLVDHVARVNATPDPVAAPAVAYPAWPSFALPQFGGFSAGGMCGPGGCGPSGGLFGGLLGGRFR